MTYCMAWRLSGPVDKRALRAALGDLVSRHEVLRTIFADVDGVGYQRILEPSELPPLLQVRLTWEADVGSATDAAFAAKFDLCADIPIRCTLIELDGSCEQVLIIVLHHIAVDQWSLRPLLDDLSVAYHERHQGRFPQWPAQAAQYADFAVWQRRLLGDEADPGSLAARQLAYWRRALARLPEGIILPVDRPRKTLPTFAGGAVEFAVRLGCAHSCAKSRCVSGRRFLWLSMRLLRRCSG